MTSVGRAGTSSRGPIQPPFYAPKLDIGYARAREAVMQARFPQLGRCERLVAISNGKVSGNPVRSRPPTPCTTKPPTYWRNTPEVPKLTKNQGGRGRLTLLVKRRPQP